MNHGRADVRRVDPGDDKETALKTTTTKDSVRDAIARAADLKREREEVYRALVRGAATGDEVEPQDILDICDATRRDPVQFEADVEALEKRIELKAKVDGREAVEAAREQVAREQAALTAEHQAATRRYEDASRILQAKLNRHDADIADAQNALRLLLQTCTDAELIARIKDMRTERNDLESRSGELRKKITEGRQFARYTSVTIDDVSLLAKDLEAEKVKVAAKTATHEKELADLVPLIAKLDRDIAQGEADMLTP